MKSIYFGEGRSTGIGVMSRDEVLKADPHADREIRTVCGVAFKSPTMAGIPVFALDEETTRDLIKLLQEQLGE